MNTIAKTPSVVGGATQPATNFNRRAFFAGGAATVLLIAAGIVVFGSLAAYVAFNGLPVGGGNDAADSVAVETSGAGAPQGVAGALGAAPGAVAATAAAGTPIAPAPTAGGAGTTGTATPPIAGTSPGTAPSGTTPTTATPTATPGAGTTAAAPGETGPVGGAVQGVDDAAAGAGVDLPLSETAAPVTGTVDQTIENLGNQVGGAVNDTTGQLLP